MSIFSIFRKKPASVEMGVDERIITPALLAKHNIEIRHLINDKWVAWLVGKSTNYRGGEAIDRSGSSKWSTEGNIIKYAWCDTRAEAVLSAVQYLAAKGVVMPTPEPTGCAVPPPAVTPLPKPEPPHGGGTIPADW